MTTSPFKNINIMNTSTFGGLTSYNPDELYVVESNSNVQSVYQNMQTSTGNIILEDRVTIYKRTKNDIPTVFDASQLTSLNKVITFELYIVAGGTYVEPVWPSNLIWVDEEPDLSVVEENNLLAFRSLDGGATWIGNLQCSW